MPTGKPELNHRSRRILYAIVSEYIASGEPVGSRTISRRYNLNLSPASIRNVLADLEEAGFLCQPHTSAGRIPTDAGFRFFVDALVQMHGIATEDRETILTRMRTLKPEQNEVIREAGRLLASMTGAAAVVTAPKPDEEALSQIRFVPLKDRTLLAVLVSRSGAVQNRVVRLERAVADDELERVHNYLSEVVRDRSLVEVRQEIARAIREEQDQYDRMRRQTKAMVEAALSDAEHDPNVVIEGQAVLFDRPEFSDAAMIRGFLRAFEEKGQLLELLDRTLGSGGVQVVIGAEANLQDLSNISVISTTYRRGGEAAGTVGVIGPARMDYAKVVPLVGFTAEAIGKVLDEGEED